MFFNLSFIFSWFSVLLGAIMAIPFLTLFERKMLSYSQNRKGPKKVSIFGLLQPITDGLKLVFKKISIFSLTKKGLFVLSPMALFLVMLMMWGSFPFSFNFVFFNLSILFFLSVKSLKVYALFLSGWSSNSTYSILGAIRGAAQTVSYEVSLFFVLFVPTILQESLTFLDFKSKFFILCFVCFPALYLWFMSCLAETKRAPFDFAEGESELVSGFKIEYSSLEFALLFLGEYGSIIFFSWVSSLLWFFNGSLLKGFIAGFFIFCFVWIRATFPRFRYDFLMDLCWKVLLPVSLFFVLFCLLV